MIHTAQLSLVEAPRVVLGYDPRRQPPDATGPFEYGAFEATLAGHASLRAWGSTEQLALAALADERRAPRGLAALDQALIAAERLSAVDLMRWLAGHADRPVLRGPAPDDGARL